MTIKMSGHPPFGAQVILNGHEYVAAAARATGVRFVKEGNCFTRLADPTALTQIADTLSEPATIGRLTQVCDRWIYTACLCFGLDLAEQARSGFTYGYSGYHAEYSRNLLFTIGAQMDKVFDRVVDRTRSRLDVPNPADPVRRQAPPRPQRHPRPVTQARSGDRYTSVLLVVVLVTGNVSVGIFAALGVGTMVLGGLGFFAARRAGGSRSDTVTWSLVSAGLGIVVILIKLVTSIRVKGV